MTMFKFNPSIEKRSTKHVGSLRPITRSIQLSKTGYKNKRAAAEATVNWKISDSVVNDSYLNIRLITQQF